MLSVLQIQPLNRYVKVLENRRPEMPPVYVYRPV
jgi:hypothetical protein